MSHLPHRIDRAIPAYIREGRELGSQGFNPYLVSRRTIALYSHPNVDLQIGTMSSLITVIRWEGGKWYVWGEWDLTENDLHSLVQLHGWKREKWGDAWSQGDVYERQNQAIIDKREEDVDNAQ